MNQRIRHLTVALLALFGIWIVQLTTWQVLQRVTLVADARNNRITVREFDKMRGAIGTAVAAASASARQERLAM